jgi:hypothetical protein
MRNDMRATWVRAATGTILIGLGLAWLLSNIGPRGPNVATIWTGHRVGLGIHLLDPLGLVPLIVGEALLFRRNGISLAWAAMGTLLLGIAIGWLLRNGRISSIWPGRDIYVYDLAALIVLILGAAMLLRVGLSERQSNPRRTRS